jgi:hypothetical protein
MACFFETLGKVIVAKSTKTTFNLRRFFIFDLFYYIGNRAFDLPLQVSKEHFAKKDKCKVNFHIGK